MAEIEPDDKHKLHQTRPTSKQNIMAARLKDKTAIIVGAGQTPGETIGNGRATSILFAREGAKLLLVDRDKSSLLETQQIIHAEGGIAEICEGDITSADDCANYVNTCLEKFGALDILHNNVGVGFGDGPVGKVSETNWRKIVDINLNGTFLSCAAALPHMREQGYGAITNISSVAAVCSTNITAYKVSKAATNAMTQDMSIANGKHGVRVNAIMPGLMDTPMAIEGIAQSQGIDQATLREQRNRVVPLGKKMGSAWDVAHAALYLASDEASFVTGVILPVDGGQSARVG